jgi:hypothetical protein
VKRRILSDDLEDTGVEEGFGLRGSGRFGRAGSSFNLITAGRAAQKLFNLEDD